MTARSSASAAAQMGEQVFAAMFPANAPFQSMGMEVMRFWAKRTKAYSELLEKFAETAEPAKLLEAEKKFFESAMDDYRASADAASRLINAAVEQTKAFTPNGRA